VVPFLPFDSRNHANPGSVLFEFGFGFLNVYSGELPDVANLP
jgi:hypothetical protein